MRKTAGTGRTTASRYSSWGPPTRTISSSGPETDSGTTLIVSSIDAAGDADEAVEWFGRNVFGGCGACRFHRQVAGGDEGWGIGGSDRALTHIESVRLVEQAIDLWSVNPRQDLLADAGPNEAYCIADPGTSYGVYLPEGGEVTLALESGDYQCRYLDAEAATWTTGEPIENATEHTLTAPDRKNQIAVLTASS